MFSSMSYRENEGRFILVVHILAGIFTCDELISNFVVSSEYPAWAFNFTEKYSLLFVLKTLEEYFFREAISDALVHVFQIDCVSRVIICFASYSHPLGY